MRARSSEGLRSSTLSQNSKRILDQNIQGQRRKERSTQPSLFTGIIFDAGGNRHSPTHSNKNGCRYRYYTSRAAIHKTERPNSPARIPALRPILNPLYPVFNQSRKIFHIARLLSLDVVRRQSQITYQPPTAGRP